MAAGAFQEADVFGRVNDLINSFHSNSDFVELANMASEDAKNGGYGMGADQLDMLINAETIDESQAVDAGKEQLNDSGFGWLADWLDMLYEEDGGSSNNEGAMSNYCAADADMARDYTALKNCPIEGYWKMKTNETDFGLAYVYYYANGSLEISGGENFNWCHIGDHCNRMGWTSPSDWDDMP